MSNIIKEDTANKIFNWANKYRVNRKKIPRDISSLEQLSKLDLEKGFLSRQKYIYDLPEELKYLKNVMYIYLGKNGINLFPTVLCKMKNLIYVDLSDNDISDVPSLYTLISMKQQNYALEYINLSNNDCRWPYLKDKDYDSPNCHNYIHDYLNKLKNGYWGDICHDTQKELKKILKGRFSSYNSPNYREVDYYVFILKVIGIEIKGLEDFKKEIQCSKGTKAGLREFLLKGTYGR